MRESVDHGYRLLLYRGNGWVSAAIRWFTWGEYSHVALLTPRGEVLEAWHFGGVRERLARAEPAVAYDVRDMTLEQWHAAERFMRRQLGKRYDFRGILGFLLRKEQPNDKWFCSELVAAALECAGVNLLFVESPSRISPSRLVESPLVIRRARRVGVKVK